MDAADADLNHILVRKDSVIAAFQAEVARWHGVQAAGLATFGVAIVAAANRALSLAALVSLLGAAVLLVVAATVAMAWHARTFTESVEFLLREIERLKARVVP